MIKINGVKLFNLEEAVQFLLQSYPETFVYEGGKLLVVRSDGKTTEINLNFVSNISFENGKLGITYSNGTTAELNMNFVSNISSKNGKLVITYSNGTTTQINMNFISNITFKNNVLTITKNDNTTYTLDLSSINKLYFHNVMISFYPTSINTSPFGIDNSNSPINMTQITNFTIELNFIFSKASEISDIEDIPSFICSSANVVFTYNNETYRGTLCVIEQGNNFGTSLLFGNTSSTTSNKYVNVNCNFNSIKTIGKDIYDTISIL